MVVLEKYTGVKSYIFPDGKLADKNAVLERYPTALSTTWIVHTDEGGEMLYYLYLLSSYKNQYDVPNGLTEAQTIQFIQDEMNKPPPEVSGNVLTNEEITNGFGILLGRDDLLIEGVNAL